MRFFPLILGIALLCACGSPSGTSDTRNEVGVVDIDTLKADSQPETSDSGSDVDPCDVRGRDGVRYLRIDAIDQIELDAIEHLAGGCLYNPGELANYYPGMGAPATEFVSPLGPPDVVVPDGSGGWERGDGRSMTLEPGAYVIFVMYRGIDIGDVLIVYEAEALTMDPAPRFLVSYGYIAVHEEPQMGLAMIEGTGPQFVSPPLAF